MGNNHVDNRDSPRLGDRAHFHSGCFFRCAQPHLRETSTGLVIAGGGTVAAALLLGSSASDSAFLLCLGLALLGATLKVPVPGMTGAISPSVVPILFAIGTRSWQETVLIAALAGITQCLWRPRRTPTALQVLFNGANLALSAGVAYAIARRGAASAPLSLFLVAAIVFQLLDTLSAATVLSLLEETPLRALWRNCHLWSFPYILASGGFAAAWAQASVPANLSAAVICAIVLYLMSTFYREIVTRTCRVASLA